MSPLLRGQTEAPTCEEPTWAGGLDATVPLVSGMPCNFNLPSDCLPNNGELISV